jgi:hypothetical protein
MPVALTTTIKVLGDRHCAEAISLEQRLNSMLRLSETVEAVRDLSKEENSYPVIRSPFLRHGFFVRIVGMAKSPRKPARLFASVHRETGGILIRQLAYPDCVPSGGHDTRTR